MGTRSAVPGREPSLGRGREKNAVSVPSGRPRWSWRFRSLFRSPSPRFRRRWARTRARPSMRLPPSSAGIPELWSLAGSDCSARTNAPPRRPSAGRRRPFARLRLVLRFCSADAFCRAAAFRCAAALRFAALTSWPRAFDLAFCPLRASVALRAAVFVCPGAETFPRATPLPGTVTPRGAVCPSRDPGCSAAGRVGFAGLVVDLARSGDADASSDPGRGDDSGDLEPEPTGEHTTRRPPPSLPFRLPLRRRRRPRLR